MSAYPKNRILVTSVPKEDGRLEENDFQLSVLKGLQFQGFEVYTTHWKNFTPEGGVNKVYSLNKDEVIGNTNLNDSFDLVHIYKLGRIYEEMPRLRETIHSLHHNFKGSLVNPGETILSTMNKDYLLYLQNKDICVPSLVKVRTPVSKNELKALTQSEKLFSEEQNFVIKPIDGERGHNVLLLDQASQEDVARLSSETSAIILQKFDENIAYGEKSIFFYNNKLSHAVHKMPKKGSILSNMCNGGKVLSYSPTSDEVDLGFQIVEHWPSTLNVVRIDLLSDHKGKNPSIMEVEACNPDFFVQVYGDDNGQAQRIGRLYQEILEGNPSPLSERATLLEKTIKVFTPD